MATTATAILQATVSVPYIERVWAMPKNDVTRIRAVNDLLMEEIGEMHTVDPFHSKSMMGYAPDYLRVISDGTAESVLLRPPTTWSQAESYVKAHGKTWDGTTRWWANLKNEAARITKSGGLVISVGWDSNGLGKNRGFQLGRILYVAHGGHWHDTCVVVERKTQMTQDEWSLSMPMGFVPDAIVGF